VHGLDYDSYLRERDYSGPVDPNRGVFLDSYFPFHPDFVYSEYSPGITFCKYYPLLCDFFDYLEQKLSTHIVIAAHPRSHYEDRPDFFGGRPVIRGRTAELVKQSGFVLLHNTVAINYAVLFKKPMIFTTTDEINRSFSHPSAEGPSVDWLASFFGKKAHNLNNKIEIDIEKELILNEKAYHAYRNAYIKKDGSEELPFWQIVANGIKGLK